ncbi:MAG: hypothetical protein ACN4G0_04755 [Polyangiales bacterium]
MSRSLKVAALVSIATLGLLLAAMHQGRTLRAARLLRDVPGSARAVLRIDTRALERSATADALLAMLVPGEQLSEIESVCGLDPRTALAEATAWVRGSEEQPIESIGLMLRGRAADAVTLADCHRLLVEARGGSIVRIDSASGPILANRSTGSAIAALDARTIVTGSVRTVAEAVAVQRGAIPSLAEGERVAALWPEVAAGAGIAAIVDPPAHWKSAIARVMELDEQDSALDRVETFALSAGPRGGEAVVIHIRADERWNAERLSAVLERWLASPPERIGPEWVQVFNTASFARHDRTIALTLNVASLSASR